MEVKNIYAYCANIGITLEEFCRRVDVTPEHFSRVVNGKSAGSSKLAKLVYHATDKTIKIPFRKKKRSLWSDEEFWAT